MEKRAENKKKIGPVALSGLMIGPILGSGIIILPPLVYGVAGNWALPAWLLMSLIGFMFAIIFGRLGVLFPGDGGVSNAIEAACGSDMKLLASYCLIGAVCFGPVAVMLTAAQFLRLDVNLQLTAMVLTCCSGCLLFRNISSIGRVAFVLSYLAAGTLFIGGVITLVFHRKITTGPWNFSGDAFGYSLLLLFWTIVGWEVIGNYSDEIKDPDKTVSRAVVFCASVIAMVSLTVAAGVQMADPGLSRGVLDVTAIIRPIFGHVSYQVMGLLAVSLCITTYLMFVGGVARLVASLAFEGHLPEILSIRTASNAPAAAIAVLTLVHLMVLLLAWQGLIHVEGLVALADGFFITNAILGLVAAMRVLDQMVLRLAAGVLVLLFTVILFHASTLVLVIICLIGAGVKIRSMIHTRVESTQH